MRFSHTCINTVVPVQFPSVLCKYTYILYSWIPIFGCEHVLKFPVIVPTVTVLQFTFVNMNRNYSFIQYRMNCWEYSVYWRCDWTPSQKPIEHCKILRGKIICCIVGLIWCQYKSLLGYMFSYFNLAFPMVVWFKWLLIEILNVLAGCLHLQFLPLIQYFFSSNDIMIHLCLLKGKRLEKVNLTSLNHCTSDLLSLIGNLDF